MKWNRLQTDVTFGSMETGKLAAIYMTSRSSNLIRILWIGPSLMQTS